MAFYVHILEWQSSGLKYFRFLLRFWGRKPWWVNLAVVANPSDLFDKILNRWGRKPPWLSFPVQRFSQVFISDFCMKKEFVTFFKNWSNDLYLFPKKKETTDLFSYQKVTIRNFSVPKWRFIIFFRTVYYIIWIPWLTIL